MMDKPKRKRSEKSKSVHKKRPLLWGAMLFYSLLLSPNLFDTQNLVPALITNLLAIVVLWSGSYPVRRVVHRENYELNGSLAGIIRNVSCLVAFILFFTLASDGWNLIDEFLPQNILSSFIYGFVKGLMPLLTPVVCFVFVIQLWSTFVGTKSTTSYTTYEKQKNNYPSSLLNELDSESAIPLELLAEAESTERRMN